MSGYEVPTSYTITSKIGNLNSYCMIDYPRPGPRCFYYYCNTN